jgi:hypothetical protein
MAAVLGSGPGAVLSHRTAAAHWGIRSWGGAIEVTAPRKSRSRRNVRRHSASLPEDEVTTKDGIPVTTVPRTLFDLAAIASLDLVENALRESEYLRLFDRLSLHHLLERYPRHRGARVVRACLERRAEFPDGRAHRGLEERFLPFLEHYGLPRPRLNAWIEVAGHRYQVDCLWPRPLVIVELDSFEAHGIRPSFEGDRARDRRLHVAGYRAPRITWRQLEGEPEAIAADLRALLAS